MGLGLGWGLGLDDAVLAHGGASVDARLGRLEGHHLVGGEGVGVRVRVRVRVRVGVWVITR